MAKKATSTEKKTKAATKNAVNSAEKSSVKSAAKPAKSLFNEPSEEAKPPKTAAKKSASSSGPSRAISVEEIGHVAGEVWGALSTGHGGSSVSVLKKSVAAPADLVMLALGWLAREDKIVIDNSGRTPTVSLR